MGRRKDAQLELPRVRGWGGRRTGAGRKLVAARRSPPHRPREPHHARWPVHVTLRARDGIPSLRSGHLFPFLQRSLAAAHKAAFRIVHFSVQQDHIHLVAEADEVNALVRGIQGLAVRCAKAVNRAVRRKGSVWSSRYHSQALRTPTQTRHAMVYVLLNFRKHLRASPGIDPRSSGPWFNGWRAPPTLPAAPAPIVPPRTWLALVGWRRAGGAIDIAELPGSRAAAYRRAVAEER